MQLGPNHHIFQSAEGEAFKIKDESKEPAHLIYRTIKFLLLTVFMHKVSTKNQTISDKFCCFFFLNMPQSTHRKRDSNMKIRGNCKEENKKVINNSLRRGQESAGLFIRFKRLPVGATAAKHCVQAASKHHPCCPAGDGI